MVHDFKKYLSIFLQMQKIGIMNRMAYPVNFFIMAGAVFFVMFLEVFFINTMFRFFPSVAGWTYHQALLVVGSFMIIEGLSWILFSQLGSVNMHIKDGSMDAIITKPVDSQFFVSVWRGDPEDATRIVSGVAVIWYAVSHLGISGWNLVCNGFFYVILLFMGLVIIYSINLLVRCVAFRVIEANGLWNIMRSIMHTVQYPTDIFYDKVVNVLVTFVIPLAFVATVPARILSGGFDTRLVFQALLVTIIIFVLSRKIWKLSLKSYSSASS